MESFSRQFRRVKNNVENEGRGGTMCARQEVGGECAETPSVHEPSGEREKIEDSRVHNHNKDGMVRGVMSATLLRPLFILTNNGINWANVTFRRLCG